MTFHESSYKKLIASVNCSKGRDEMVLLCQSLCDNGADELLIHDLSHTDKEHDEMILTLKDIVHTVDIPVIAGGNVKRLEDVKRYLYAGAKAVYLDMSVQADADMVKDAEDRFGPEKIYKMTPDGRYTDHEDDHYITINGDPDLKVIEEELSDPSVSGVIIPSESVADWNGIEWKYDLKQNGIEVDTFESSIDFSEFKLGPDGLIPVVVQDYRTLRVLMVAYMNEEAFDNTLKSGKMTYYSRERKTLWVKGETSGHYQFVKSLTLDCDKDTILAKVRQIGPACHTGEISCFFNTLAEKEYRTTNPLTVFEQVYDVILERQRDPKEGSYTNYLFDKGIDKILKKIGEESSEIIIASKNTEPEELIYEMSDFLYHMMVLMAEKGITWEEITEELADRN